MGYFTYLIGAGIVFVWSMIVQANLKYKMKEGAGMRAGSGKTANEVVEEMLRAHEVYGITIEHKPGELTDCYSPKEGKIYLSDTTYGRDSVTAIAVAAHEAGHAVQDHENMLLYEIRQLLAPVAGISSRLGPYIVIAGVLVSSIAESSNDLGYMIGTLGIVVYFVAFLFYLFMLPVERNASNRAFKDMKEYGWVSNDQLSFARSALRAAGDTYAVALASSALTLLRLLAIRGSRGSRRR
ncbi:MAG: zinc metallopeptidase [Clostridiales bacterium]|nr:zinc metallopeptidase [Clostridiales bacterium]